MQKEDYSNVVFLEALASSFCLFSVFSLSMGWNDLSHFFTSVGLLVSLYKDLNILILLSFDCILLLLKDTIKFYLGYQLSRVWDFIWVFTYWNLKTYLIIQNRKITVVFTQEDQVATRKSFSWDLLHKHYFQILRRNQIKSFYFDLMTNNKIWKCPIIDSWLFVYILCNSKRPHKPSTIWNKLIKRL